MELCYRCRGYVITETIWDDDGKRFAQERCIKCGDRTDAVILNNRSNYYIEPIKEEYKPCSCVALTQEQAEQLLLLTIELEKEPELLSPSPAL